MKSGDEAFIAMLGVLAVMAAVWVVKLCLLGGALYAGYTALTCFDDDRGFGQCFKQEL